MLGRTSNQPGWLERCNVLVLSLMTGSAFHKAMAQDAVRLSQMTGTKGWVAGLSKALQAAGYQSINQFYSLSWDLCTDPSDYLHVLS